MSGFLARFRKKPETEEGAASPRPPAHVAGVKGIAVAIQEETDDALRIDPLDVQETTAKPISVIEDYTHATLPDTREIEPDVVVTNGVSSVVPSLALCAEDILPSVTLPTNLDSDRNVLDEASQSSKVPNSALGEASTTGSSQVSQSQRHTTATSGANGGGDDEDDDNFIYVPDSDTWEAPAYEPAGDDEDATLVRDAIQTVVTLNLEEEAKLLGSTPSGTKTIDSGMAAAEESEQNQEVAFRLCSQQGCAGASEVAEKRSKDVKDGPSNGGRRYARRGLGGTEPGGVSLIDWFRSVPSDPKAVALWMNYLHSWREDLARRIYARQRRREATRRNMDRARRRIRQLERESRLWQAAAAAVAGDASVDLDASHPPSRQDDSSEISASIDDCDAKDAKSDVSTTDDESIDVEFNTSDEEVDLDTEDLDELEVAAHGLNGLGTLRTLPGHSGRPPQPTPPTTEREDLTQLKHYHFFKSEVFPPPPPPRSLAAERLLRKFKTVPPLVRSQVWLALSGAGELASRHASNYYFMLVKRYYDSLLAWSRLTDETLNQSALAQHNCARAGDCNPNAPRESNLFPSYAPFYDFAPLGDKVGSESHDPKKAPSAPLNSSNPSEVNPIVPPKPGFHGRRRSSLTLINKPDLIAPAAPISPQHAPCLHPASPSGHAPLPLGRSPPLHCSLSALPPREPVEGFRLSSPRISSSASSYEASFNRYSPECDHPPSPAPQLDAQLERLQPLSAIHNDTTKTRKSINQLLEEVLSCAHQQNGSKTSARRTAASASKDVAAILSKYPVLVPTEAPSLTLSGKLSSLQRDPQRLKQFLDELHKLLTVALTDSDARMGGDGIQIPNPEPFSARSDTTVSDLQSDKSFTVTKPSHDLSTPRHSPQPDSPRLPPLTGAGTGLAAPPLQTPVQRATIAPTLSTSFVPVSRPAFLDSDEEVKKDLLRTLPEHPLFQTASGLQRLYRILTAYSVRNAEGVGYCQSTNFVAGVLLAFMVDTELKALKERRYARWERRREIMRALALSRIRSEAEPLSCLYRGDSTSNPDSCDSTQRANHSPLKLESLRIDPNILEEARARPDLDAEPEVALTHPTKTFSSIHEREDARIFIDRIARNEGSRGFGDQQMTELKKLNPLHLAIWGEVDGPELGSDSFLQEPKDPSIADLPPSIVDRCEEQTFWLTVALVERRLGYYARSMCGLDVDMKVLATLLDHYSPRLSSHLRSHEVSVSIFAVGWFMCLFVNPLTVIRIAPLWDRLFLHQDVTLFEAALAILDHQQNTILSLRGTDELLMFLLSGKIVLELDVVGLLSRHDDDPTHVAELFKRITRLRTVHKQSIIEKAGQLPPGSARKHASTFRIDDVYAAARGLPLPSKCAAFAITANALLEQQQKLQAERERRSEDSHRSIFAKLLSSKRKSTDRHPVERSIREKDKESDSDSLQHSRSRTTSREDIVKESDQEACLYAPSGASDPYRESYHTLSELSTVAARMADSQSDGNKSSLPLEVVAFPPVGSLPEGMTLGTGGGWGIYPEAFIDDEVLNGSGPILGPYSSLYRSYSLTAMQQHAHNLLHNWQSQGSAVNSLPFDLFLVSASAQRERKQQNILLPSPAMLHLTRRVSVPSLSPDDLWNPSARTSMMLQGAHPEASTKEEPTPDRFLTVPNVTDTYLTLVPPTPEDYVQHLWRAFLAPDPWATLIHSSLGDPVTFVQAFVPHAFSVQHRQRWCSADLALCSSVADKLFLAADLTRTGRVTFEEFLLAVTTLQFGSQDLRHAFAFRFFNRGCGDKVSFADLVDGFTALHKLYYGDIDGGAAARSEAMLFATTICDRADQAVADRIVLTLEMNEVALVPPSSEGGSGTPGQHLHDQATPKDENPMIRRRSGSVVGGVYIPDTLNRRSRSPTESSEDTCGSPPQVSSAHEQVNSPVSKLSQTASDEAIRMDLSDLDSTPKSVSRRKSAGSEVSSSVEQIEAACQIDNTLDKTSDVGFISDKGQGARILHCPQSPNSILPSSSNLSSNVRALPGTSTAWAEVPLPAAERGLTFEECRAHLGIHPLCTVFFGLDTVV